MIDVAADSQRLGEEKSRRLAMLVGLACGGVFIVLGVLFFKAMGRLGDDGARGPCRAFGARQVRIDGLKGASLRRVVWSEEGQVQLGEPIVLGATLGRWVVVNFWLSSCLPCLEEMPSLLTLAQRAKPYGARVILANVDSSPEHLKEVGKRLFAMGLLRSKALVVHDTGRKLATSLGVTKFPETFLFDVPNGVGYRVVSTRDWLSVPARRCLSLLWKR